MWMQDAVTKLGDGPRRPVRGPSSTRRMLVAVVVGVAVGLLLPDRAGMAGFHASDLAVVSTLFLRLVKSMIAPLVFATLVVGIAGHGAGVEGVGRLAVRSILYFEVVTTIALVVGLVTGNVVHPGRGVTMGRPPMTAGALPSTPPPSFVTLLEHVVPESVIDAMARNDALQIVVFATLFAVGLTRVRGDAKTFMLSACESLSEVMFKFAGIVVSVAPVGVGAAIAATVGKNGLGALRPLGLLVGTLYGALVVFALVVLLPIALVARVPLRRFVSAVREPWLVAFSTASSEAALPLALRNLEAMGVPRRVASFVLPTGYAFNMDGTALYLSLAVLFVAQSAGIDLPLGKQLLVLVTLMLTSKGIAAIPRAALVVLTGALTQFGLPVEGVALILAVDAFMDMGRTSINVVGNCLAAVVMARWDGSFSVPAEPSSTARHAPTLTRVRALRMVERT
ncbi:MAG: dicarboxylate/amino acid:cation symporter [Gemmatimonadetes bacterium]|nr:MAG: dicarboxylate/amino acid:cation symporter [Gemmatimonadota bacterium]